LWKVASVDFTISEKATPPRKNKAPNPQKRCHGRGKGDGGKRPEGKMGRGEGHVDAIGRVRGNRRDMLVRKDSEYARI